MLSKTINVLIVSPQSMFRKGMEMSLLSEEDIQILDSVDFKNGVEYSVENLPPDIAIVDIDGSEDTGFDISQRLKQRLPNISLLIFSSYQDDERLFLALKAQAAAFMSKEATKELVIETIRRLARGEYPINEALHTRPKIAEHVLQKFQELTNRSDTEDFISPLTNRENEVLQYISKGYLNKQIAAAIDIGEQTIKNHVTSILRKLNANARTEAVVIGIKRGIISIE